MEIEIELNKNDLELLGQYQVENSSKLHNRANKLRWAYTVGFLFLAVGGYFISPNIFVSLGFVIIAIISAIFYPAYYQKRVQRHVTRLVEEQSKSESFARRKLRATVEGLEQESGYADRKANWHLVESVDITPTNTFISIEGIYTIIIPKSSVKHGNYDLFIKTIRQYTNNE